MALFQDKTVSKKLNIVAITIGVLFLIGMTLTFVSTSILTGNFENFYFNEFSISRQRGDFAMAKQSADKNVTKMILVSMNGANATEADKYYNLALADNKVMLANLDKIKASEMGDSQGIKAIELRMAEGRQYVDHMHELCLQGQGPAAWQQYENQYFPMSHDIRVNMDSVIQAADKSAKQHIENMSRLKYTLYISTPIVAILLLLFLVYVTKSLCRMILHPLQALQQVAVEVSRGQLDRPIDYHGKDEFGVLADAFRNTNHVLAIYIGEIEKFTEAIGEGRLNYCSAVEFKGDFNIIRESLENISDSLSKAMSQIDSSAEQVTKGAEQIAAAGQSLSQATVEQASSVTELAATINNVSAQVEKNAANAVEASSRTNDVSRQIVASSQDLDNLNQIMHQLQAMTGEISGIIKDIEELSFQTNILSLNATVEAARAGDAGRGFVDIANEVRRLAGSSSEASKRTNNLINKTIQMINESTSKTETAAHTLGQVSDEVKHTTGMIDEISLASNNQATSIAQIRQSIDMISEVIQENSATAEESAASSEELMGQMKMMKKLVESFEYTDKK